MTKVPLGTSEFVTAGDVCGANRLIAILIVHPLLIFRICINTNYVSSFLTIRSACNGTLSPTTRLPIEFVSVRYQIIIQIFRFHCSADIILHYRRFFDITYRQLLSRVSGKELDFLSKFKFRLEIQYSMQFQLNHSNFMPLWKVRSSFLIHNLDNKILDMYAC